MDSLDFRSVEQALADCRWGHTLFIYDSIGSTMDRARELVHQSAPEGTLVISAEQTEGRGRLNREWISPAGSLSLSLLLYPSPEKLPYLTMLAGLAVAESIDETTHIHSDLKWPNDILINSKKVAGILVESGVSHCRQFAVIGIGINVNVDIDSYPEIADIATSLAVDRCQHVDPLTLLRSVILKIETLYLDFNQGIILNLWANKLITLGQQVKATSGSNIIEGIAIGLTDNGALVIRQSDGNECSVIAGDVTLS